MKPTIGRIVHYQSFGTPGGEHLPEPRAAVITTVHAAPAADVTPSVGLAVLNPTGRFFNVDVPYSPTPKPGDWNWPPREPPTRRPSAPRASPDAPPPTAESVTQNPFRHTEQEAPP